MTRAHAPLGGRPADSHSLSGVDRGLSQIVSVILLIAVATILIGGVGAAVFGIFGSSLGQPAPQVQVDFSWTASTNQTTISLTGGEQLGTDNTGAFRGRGSWVASDRIGQHPRQRVHGIVDL